jgi:argonaute-like protein implicated in RNA metabolism and viral defense
LIGRTAQEIMHILKDINIQTNTKLCSTDITNMYTNIPQKDMIPIINNTLEHKNTPKNQKEEIIILVKTILNQNYMQHTDHPYKQNEGLATGAPT